ncbi:hypothetical protein TPA0910_34550 [Streptomyces hygroscopicus subsp. sporocinereus]|uniref:Lipoprotein n=1 Tax=Streptomyces hygroscopicus TaxID=1912 RepID=A0ABQ3U0V6_STRHY|nr:hypothetical protein [Streptomyces hygroscopicus]GHJ29022.1 hypothetical protein TPA0910_34550 [Streptomyces hygroscopicus]
MTLLDGRKVYASLALLSALTLTVGCSSMDGNSSGLEYEPQVRKSRAVEEEVGTLSSRLLEMLKIKGKVTDLAPMASSCQVDDDDTEKYRSVRHPWSMYDVDNNALEKGMDNLAEQLPKQGWRVVKDGPDESRNRNREILAVHTKTHTQMEATWMKGLDGHEPMISFAVYSRCFRDPGHSS